MKKLLRNHPETVLAALAIVFAAAIIAAYAWGVGNVVVTVDRAVSPAGASAGAAGFNLQGAAQLDLRGLVK